MVHRRGRSIVADVDTGLVLRPGEIYRVRHPAAGGDRCTVLAIRRQDPSEAVLHRSVDATAIGSQTQLAVHFLTAMSRREALDELEVEEVAVGVLQTAAEDLGSSAGLTDHLSIGGQRRAAEVRAVLSSKPEVRWTLGLLAGLCIPRRYISQGSSATERAKALGAI